MSGHADQQSTDDPRASDPWPGATLVVRERTGSTMDDALELARSGCASGSAVMAGYQEKGRGRVPGRTWVSPPWESLLATVVLRRSDITFPLLELPLRAGVAVARAVEKAAGLAVHIKWPNDVLVGERKLVGLLCEARGDAALVGIGVNCTQTRFPEEFATPACSILQLTGRTVAPRDLLPFVLRALRDVLGDPGWRDALIARLYARGKSVTVDLLGSGQSVRGVIDTVDEQGRLVIVTPGGDRVPVAQGEIRTGP